MPELYGSQVPTFTTAPDSVEGQGDEAIAVFGHYGVRFYGSQKYELRLYLARGAYGDFAQKAIYSSKPRQNGKSFAAQFYCVWCACVLHLRVLFTAHRARTVRKMFKAIADFITQHADFMRALMPHGIYRAPGYEGIYFARPDGKPGGFIEFVTRSQSGGRGDTFDVIVIDEAQELTADQAEALLPTTIASADVSRQLSQQVIYIGTPPGEKCTGTEFQLAHDRAHAGVLYGAWWVEWAADAPVSKDDRDAALEAIRRTNPAFGYRIREDAILERWGKMTPEGFAREHLGWWSDYRQGQILIDAHLWEQAATSSPPKTGLKAFGVKFEPGGAYAAMCVALKPPQGAMHVELVKMYETSHGLAELQGDLMRAARAGASEIVVDGAGYAQTLIERLLQSGIHSKLIHRPSMAEVSAAASNLIACVREGNVTHFNQELLNDSATKTGKRAVGRAGGFSFASTEDAYAEPIEAAAIALLWAMKTTRDPTKKAVML